MNWLSAAAICLTSLISAAALAQTAPKKPVVISSGSSVRINYGHPGWNKDPLQIDTAIVLLKTGESGRLVRISLVETEPDSSIFSGLYSIGFVGSDKLEAEFYIPPQDLAVSESGLSKLTEQIRASKLKRNPFILRRTREGQQTAELFDTKEQARLAAQAYRAEQAVSLQNQKIKKFPSDEDVSTAELAKDLKQKEAEAKALVDRARTEQLEAKRMEELRLAQAKLAASEKAKRREQSTAIGQQGIQFFKANEFPQAKNKFNQALTLDPENKIFYFQYGVTLYRLDEYDRAIAMLKLAEDPSVNQTERNFYLGLTHFKLKEFKSAKEYFAKCIAAKDVSLSPSAAFYTGIMEFDEKQWDQAQASFQLVLDTSKDPNLDARADEYIELILRSRRYEEEAKQKWTLTATLGEIFDSNVLLSADSSRDTGLASNTAGYRTMFAGSAKYRSLHTETREFAAQLDLLTMFTVATDFQIADSLRDTDPMMATLTLPYTIKGLAFGKGYRGSIVPGYESIYMSVEDHTNKEILSTVSLASNNLFVMSDDWFANYNLELRNEMSKLNSSTGTSDSSALKVKITNSNLVFISTDKTQMITPEVALTVNNAKGTETLYNRYDLGIGYLRPSFWDTNFNANLGYFLVQYPKHSSKRSDNSYTLTTGLSKKLSEIWTSGFTLSYNMNSSNVDAYQYSKITVMLSLSAAYGF